MLLKLPASKFATTPLRASIFTPPRSTDPARLGLLPLSVMLSTLTLFASTRTTLLASPPHNVPGSHSGLDTEVRITVFVAPAPLSVSSLLTTTFSTYSPSPIEIVEPEGNAAIAALMLVKGQPDAQTVLVGSVASAELAPARNP